LPFHILRFVICFIQLFTKPNQTIAYRDIHLTDEWALALSISHELEKNDEWALAFVDIAWVRKK
jgi:hypothetical protein